MNEIDATSERLMRETIALARDNVRTHRGGPFAAIIVSGDEVIATGVNRVTVDNDPTAHAEIAAIRSACHVRGSFDLSGLELYASCEPCPMCLGAIYWAKLDRVIFAADRLDAAAVGFEDASIYDELQRSFDRRRLPFTRLLREEAVQVLSEWRDDPAREPY
jgi:tRNA(Arg) A34 adenosine deaminase TadA